MATPAEYSTLKQNNNYLTNFFFPYIIFFENKCILKHINHYTFRITFETSNYKFRFRFENYKLYQNKTTNFMFSPQLVKMLNTFRRLCNTLINSR